MAQTTQELATNSRCYDCIPVGMRDAVLIYLLGVIAGVTDIPTLMANAACYDCIPVGIRKSVQIYLENMILSGGGGGGASSGVTCSAASDPSGIPTGSCGLWVRLDTSQVWVYNSGSGNWDALIA